MKQGVFSIAENIKLTDNVYKMKLLGDVSDITSAGQFVNIKLDGLYLRRPISVYDRDKASVTIIYKIVGECGIFRTNHTFYNIFKRSYVGAFCFRVWKFAF